MSGKRWMLGMLWLLTVVGAAVTGWHAGFRQGESALVRAESTPMPEEPESTVSQDAAASREESVKLHARLAVLEEERKSLGRDYLQLALKTAIESSGPATPAASINARTRWEKGASEILAKRGGMFGGLEEGIALLLDIAALGEPGMRYLGLVANDGTRPDEERELALQMLARLRHPAAFDILAAFRDDGILELDYPYDLIRGHVASLPTQDIARRIPEMLNRIDSELGANNFSPERVEVLLLLATTHGNPRARQLLKDARMRQENVRGALEAARAVHDPVAMAFVRDMAQYHEDPGHRRYAAQILEQW